MTKTSHPKIIKDNGFMFRAVDEATGFRSYLVTSAAQAGIIIGRRFGKDAHRVAFEEYCGLTD
jgi:hypothetical protein